MVRVGLCALTLIPDVVGGSETAFRALLRELPKFPDIDPLVYLSKISADAHEDLNHTVVMSYRANRSNRGRLLGMSEATYRGSKIRREMGLDRLDVLHFPFSTMIPTVESVPTVSSILDVQHEYVPQFFSKPEIAYRRLIYGRTARKSDLVIAISHHAADTIHERLGVPRERIRVIYLGADPQTFSPGPEARKPFLLYPANNWPHKNHQRLYEALMILRRTHPELELVITGSGHVGTELPEGVIARGRVSTPELVRLYRTASALVYPSLYEGFGLPVIEAMSTGCPVASSNVSSLPEVCGDAAMLFDPNSVEGIVEAVDRLLSDPAPYVARGLERAPMFTWEKTAAAHVDVYRELAQR
jgi:glycosyltransferase involved in cell wall biosynthesis